MSTEIRIPVLSAQDVESLDISFSTMLELLETSFRAHGEGKIENPPKPGIHPRPQSFIHAMPAYVQTENQVAGIKWVSSFTANRDKGLPTIVGLIVLNNPDTGLPIALMDGTWITNARTAAATGVCARYILRGDETTLSVLGCGLQGTYNTMVLSLVMPQLKRVVVYDPYAPAIEKFRSEVEQNLPNVELKVVDTAEAAAGDGDVVVWAVPPLKKDERPFCTDWLKPGSTLFTVSNSGLNRDFPRKITHITDDWGQLKYFFKDYYDLSETPITQIGELVTGKKQARADPNDTVVVSTLGLAIHDMVVAGYVLEKAKAAGRGTDVVLDQDCMKTGKVPRLV